MSNKKALFLITIILLCSFLIFNACQKETIPTRLHQRQTTQAYDYDFNKTNFKLRKVSEHRITDFIAHLNDLGAEVQSPKDLLQKASSSQARQQLSDLFDIDPFYTLVHVELANLLQLGLSEIDAQLLHFSHWNHLNLFTGEVMNSATLAEADPEKILMSIHGWAAGHPNSIVQQYKIDLSDIEAWINAATDAGHCPIQYSNAAPSSFASILSSSHL